MLNIIAVYIVSSLLVFLSSRGLGTLLSASAAYSLVVSVAEHLPISIVTLMVIILFVSSGMFTRSRALDDRIEEERILRERKALDKEKLPPPPGFRLTAILSGHSDSILSMAWSPDGQQLASGSKDQTIRLWDVQTGVLVRILEGHTDYIKSISISSDGRLLASKSGDATVRVWSTATWQAAVIPEANSKYWPPKVAFHPSAPILATLGQRETVIRIWNLDIDAILRALSTEPSVSYTNVKIVLVGDSGVGKSGLGLVLTGRPFVSTESTHARRIWSFDPEEVELAGEQREVREVLLWDVAGQPGYRLIHQLHLNEVAVALVVFDARSETDPFTGVQHWDRALRQAQRVQGNGVPPLKKFLVAARTDRGGIGVSTERIQSLMEELHFDGYFETSAREGRHIAELRTASLSLSRKPSALWRSVSSWSSACSSIV